MVIPYVLETRREYKSCDKFGEPMRAFVTCDGEAKQIEVFQEPKILEAFQDALIDLGKTPASCSAICQASDASPFFKQAKEHLKTFTELSEYRSHESMVVKLNEILKARTFSTERQNAICHGIKAIQYTIQNVLTVDYVKSGYERIGQWPISFDKALGMVAGTISTKYVRHMRSKFAELADIFRTNGVLTEQDMDDNGIVCLYEYDQVLGDPPSSVPKDERALHRQRATVMNSANVVQFYRKYNEVRAQRSLVLPAAGPPRSAADFKPLALFNRWLGDLTSEEQKEQKKITRIKKGKKARAAEMYPELLARYQPVEVNQEVHVDDDEL